MKFFEAVEQFPRLCGTPQADRWAWIIKATLTEEVKNPESVWARKKLDVGKNIEPIEETPWDRADVPNSWRFFAPNKAMAEYCYRLQILTMIAHAVLEHRRDDLADKMETLRTALEKEEPLYPNVSAIYTVKEAAEGRWW
jgi:hypothetical protein